MPLWIRAAKFLYMNVFELMIRDNTMNILDNTVSIVINEYKLYLHLLPEMNPVCENFEKSLDVLE